MQKLAARFPRDLFVLYIHLSSSSSLSIDRYIYIYFMWSLRSQLEQPVGFFSAFFRLPYSTPLPPPYPHYLYPYHVDRRYFYFRHVKYFLAPLLPPLLSSFLCVLRRGNRAPSPTRPPPLVYSFCYLCPAHPARVLSLTQPSFPLLFFPYHPPSFPNICTGLHTHTSPSYSIRCAFALELT